MFDSNTMSDLIEDATERAAEEQHVQLQGLDSCSVQNYMEALEQQGLLEPVRSELPTFCPNGLVTNG